MLLLVQNKLKQKKASSASLATITTRGYVTSELRVLLQYNIIKSAEQGGKTRSERTLPYVSVRLALPPGLVGRFGVKADRKVCTVWLTASSMRQRGRNTP